MSKHNKRARVFMPRLSCSLLGVLAVFVILLLMIYISIVGSNTGTSFFYCQSYTGANGSYISFYYNFGAGNYTIAYDTKEITLSIITEETAKISESEWAEVKVSVRFLWYRN